MSGGLNYGKPGAGNLTLTAGELEACQPVRAGGRIRAFCPFHGSDQQRSLSLDMSTGRFSCFACAAWGYSEQHREEWTRERRASNTTVSRGVVSVGRRIPLPPKLAPTTPALPNLAEILAGYQRAMQPGSAGARYLEQRGIPLDLAKQYGIGYAAGGAWVHRDQNGAPFRQGGKLGRITFPHTDPDGVLVNLYGRAVELDGITVPKVDRHDHLPGSKGYFNASVLQASSGPLFVTEGPLDAMALIAAGQSQVVAIFGVYGWRWEWARSVRRMVLAFDADGAGEVARTAMAQEAVIRGISVAVLSRAEYGSCKDAAEAWVTGCLNVGEWQADRQQPLGKSAGLPESPDLPESAKPIGEPAGPCQHCGGLAYWRAAEDWLCMACTPTGEDMAELLYLPAEETWSGPETLCDCGPLPG